EDIDNYKLISGYPKDVVFIKDIDLTELLMISEIVITDLSTVGLEAMLLNTPVITVNFTGKPDAMPYASSGAAIGVSDPNKLKEAVQSILNNQDTKNRLQQNAKIFLKDYLYKLDGRSAERVNALIEEMIMENN
ncbi:MAG: glycosyltransferase, partial [Candidatus Peribacteraceae bacterium]|nr:glycosyltransferase [Candidatus Peribacteraceae bacterium]